MWGQTFIYDLVRCKEIFNPHFSSKGARRAETALAEEAPVKSRGFSHFTCSLRAKQDSFFQMSPDFVGLVNPWEPQATPLQINRGPSRPSQPCCLFGERLGCVQGSVDTPETIWFYDPTS
jgi:hypothetical protein